MKKSILYLGLVVLLAQSVWAFQPTGWVYSEGDWAFESETQAWIWLNPGDELWVYCYGHEDGWRQRQQSALTQGWVYYRWPFVYSQNNQAWHYVNEANRQTVFNMSKGTWSVLGQAITNEGLGTRGHGGGFIWKPVSEGDRKLVVLLPQLYRRKVNGAWIARADGSVVEQGRFDNDTHNGYRPHYRFSKPGAHYGRDLFLVTRLIAGGVHFWPIPNGASRYDY